MRVSENSSVSVEMVAGFDLMPFDSVTNQTHFSLSAMVENKEGVSESESATFDFNSIEIGPTHLYTSSIIIHFCFSTPQSQLL